MSADPKALAEKLLDGLVDHVIADVTERFDETVVREIDLVLAAAETLVLGDVIDPADLKETARLGIDHIGDGTLIGELVIPFADAFYNLKASSDYTLAEVLEREKVEEIVALALRLNTAQNRLFERLTLSPLAASLASRFVGKIVGDVLAENRKKAEKLPGMSSLFSVGDRVASTAAKVGKSQIDAVTGRGGQYALKQTEGAVKDLIKNAPVQEAALEVWDLHADEPVSELRKYLSEEENRDVATLGYDVVDSVRGKELTLALVDAWIDTFFEQRGDRTVKQLLDELGLTRDDLVTEGSRLAPPIIEALIANGVLAQQIRVRLEPFFLSDSTLALLSADGD